MNDKLNELQKTLEKEIAMRMTLDSELFLSKKREREIHIEFEEHKKAYQMKQSEL